MGNYWKNIYHQNEGLNKQKGKLEPEGCGLNAEEGGRGFTRQVCKIRGSKLCICLDSNHPNQNRMTQTATGALLLTSVYVKNHTKKKV